jgi:hypothetical protein
MKTTVTINDMDITVEKINGKVHITLVEDGNWLNKFQNVVIYFADSGSPGVVGPDLELKPRNWLDKQIDEATKDAYS